MRIVFMGTPTFALNALQALVEDGQEIALVISQPDKPKGRGHAMVPSEVKQYALEKGFRVETPSTLRTPEAEELLKSIDADLFVVAAYGKILPQNILDLPKHGCVCVHASLLPAWRGAAPIQRAIMNGDTVGGVTIMYMDAGVDTGDILLQRSMEIPIGMNAGKYHDALCELGKEALIAYLRQLESGKTTRTKQQELLKQQELPYAEKITKEDQYTKFEESAQALCDRIRGLAPAPSVFTFLGDKRIKLHEACVEQPSGDCGEPGTVMQADKTGLIVACQSGSVRITCVQPEGKGRMDAASFVNGLQNKEGLRFS